MNEPKYSAEAPDPETISGSRIERIAVVSDGSADDDALLGHAAALAAAAGASLSLVAVVERRDLERVAARSSLSREEAEQRVLDAERERREALVSRARAHVPLALDVRMGKPFLELIRHVGEQRTDLLMKTAERLPSRPRTFFASIDQHLLRKCPCTVWLLPPGSPPRIRSVLATVDVDDLAPQAEVAAALNRRIVATAASLAAFHAAPLHLLHVWDAPGEALVHRWAADDVAARRYVDEVREQRRRALESLRQYARRVRGPNGAPVGTVNAHLVRGQPREVVSAQVKELGADLLVLGTVARVGVAGLLIGNTAEDILNSIDCAVVTVKPPGYVTPVQS